MADFHNAGGVPALMQSLCEHCNLDAEIKDFYKFTIDDIKLEGYEHLGKIEMPVSV